MLQTNDFLIDRYQRWSPRERPWPRGRPREHILKSLALALASKPQVLENCPFLGWRTALFLEPLKFFWKTPETSRKIYEDLFFFSFGDCLKKIFEDLFLFFCFWRTLGPVSLVLGLGREHCCPSPLEGLSSEGLYLVLASDFFVSLASSLMSSTPPLDSILSFACSSRPNNINMNI